MEIYKEIRLIADSEVPIGTTGRFRCPKCGGGESKEKCLSITHLNGRVLFKCHRDKCGVQGACLPGNITFSPKPREVAPLYFSEETSKLDTLQRNYLRSMFGLDNVSMQDITYCEREKRYVLPVEDSFSNRRGVIARSVNGSNPKAINYNEKPTEPFIGWFQNMTKNTELVLVEDWFSAAKVCQAGFTSVSLNGTAVGYDTAAEIAEYARTCGPELINKVIIALDAGAARSQLKILKEFGPLWPDTRLLFLDKDLKYEEERAIVDAIKSGTPLIGGGSKGKRGSRRIIL